jgi:putative transcription factor
MVQCEMCGTDVAHPNTVKIEGAELDVCTDCEDFGTEVRTESTTSSTSKYSTSTSSSSDGATTSSSEQGTPSSRPRNDMFDRMDEVAQDYDDRIRKAREVEGLSQEELAGNLNEKASLIRKLERGDMLPNDTVQQKLERALDISLVEGGGRGGDTDDWSSGGDAGEYTLGDVVRRKD